MSIGVGIIGGGAVTQSIHLPTLARLPELFSVKHVMDIDPDTARLVADRSGARWTTRYEDVLDDPEVDVVAVCSPPAWHPEQVIAACRAGKRTVLCEKPLANSVEEGSAMLAAARASGTRLVVGAMHLHDPGWLELLAHSESLSTSASLIRSSIVLPYNDRYERWGTEFRVPPRRPIPPTGTAAERAAVLTQRMLGVAIHDLPLIRVHLAEWRDIVVTHVRLINPTGYAVTVRSGAQILQLSGSMRDYWRPEWDLDLYGERQRLSVTFTPSYVHAGSASGRLVTGRDSVVVGSRPQNGYEMEWVHLAQIHAGARIPEDPATLLDDIEFALSIAGAAARRMEEDG